MDFDLGRGRMVVQEGELLVWKSRAELTDDDLVCFYDGDYSDVLEPSDPRVRQQRAQQHLHAA